MVVNCSARCACFEMYLNDHHDDQLHTDRRSSYQRFYNRFAPHATAAKEAQISDVPGAGAQAVNPNCPVACRNSFLHIHG